MKKLLQCLAILTLVGSLSGCQFTKQDPKTNSSEQTKQQETRIIGATMAAESPYLTSVSSYMSDAAIEKDVDLQLVYANWNVNTQIKQMYDFIDQKVDAIILAPVNAKSMLTPLKKAKEAGIPVINLNMKVDNISTEYIDTYVGASSSEEASKAALLFVELLGEKGGEIAIIEGAPGSDPQIYRTQTFIEQLTSHPQIKIVGIGNADWSRKKAELVTRDLLQKNPNIQGIYCQDSEMAMGVITALENMQMNGKISIVGIGENEEYLQAVKEHKLAGIITQPPEYEGKYSIYCAVMSIEGIQLRPWYKDPIEIVTPQTVGNYKFVLK